jgi:hypothetical protein
VIFRKPIKKTIALAQIPNPHWVSLAWRFLIDNSQTDRGEQNKFSHGRCSTHKLAMPIREGVFFDPSRTYRTMPLRPRLPVRYGTSVPVPVRVTSGRLDSDPTGTNARKQELLWKTGSKQHKTFSFHFSDGKHRNKESVHSLTTSQI